MSVVLFASIIDDWKEKLALEHMPDMTLPVPGYVAYALMGLGGIFLLVALWRLLKLKIFRSFFAFIAAILVSYYPLTYAMHWWLFKFDAAAKAERDLTGLEKTLINNLRYVDWGIMGAGIFLGVLLFYLTTGGGKKDEYEEEEYDAPPAPRPGQKSRSRKAAPPPSAKDPFDFT